MDNFLSGLQELGVGVTPVVAQREIVFLEELLHWNQRVNLTSVRNRDEAIEKHLIDSLALLPHLCCSGALLDMGSGGGLPGIPLAIAQAEREVVSVDSVGKKINFQKHIKRKLQLKGLSPIQSRLEDLHSHLQPDLRFRYVVARAFSSFDVISGFAAPWLGDGGQLLVMKGPEGLDELSGMEKPLTSLGLVFEKSHKYRLPFSGSERQLIVIKKQPA